FFCPFSLWAPHPRLEWIAVSSCLVLTLPFHFLHPHPLSLSSLSFFLSFFLSFSLSFFLFVLHISFLSHPSHLFLCVLRVSLLSLTSELFLSRVVSSHCVLVIE